jgi:hypothetical protein
LGSPNLKFLKGKTKMFKKLMLVLAILPTLAMAGFNDYKYEISVVDEESVGSLPDPGIITSGVLTFVYTAGTKTLATLYSNKNRTSLTNPISRAQFATDDMIKFYAAASSVDIVVAHQDGSIAKFASFTPTKHRIPLNRGGVDKCIVIPFSASDATEVNTGIELPSNTWVKDVVVEVATADDTETLDVGLLSTQDSGSAAGLLNDVTMSPTGFKKPLLITTGATETYISTAYYGPLMGPILLGSNSDGDFGMGTVPGHLRNATTASVISYTGSSGSDTAAGYIYVFYKHLR